jgi:hypothetical protein
LLACNHNEFVYCTLKQKIAITSSTQIIFRQISVGRRI